MVTLTLELLQEDRHVITMLLLAPKSSENRENFTSLRKRLDERMNCNEQQRTGKHLMNIGKTNETLERRQNLTLHRDHTIRLHVSWKDR